MPGPVFRGRPVREIIVPQKTVVKNDCERCGRTWFSDEQTETAKAVVRMRGAHGEVIVDASYDVICEGCEKTVANLLRTLARQMKKLSPRKSKAKKEGAVAPPSEPPLMPAANSGPGPVLTASTPPVAPFRGPPSGVSKRQ